MPETLQTHAVVKTLFPSLVSTRPVGRNEASDNKKERKKEGRRGRVYQQKERGETTVLPPWPLSGTT